MPAPCRPQGCIPAQEERSGAVSGFSWQALQPPLASGWIFHTPSVSQAGRHTWSSRASVSFSMSAGRTLRASGCFRPRKASRGRSSSVPAIAWLPPPWPESTRSAWRCRKKSTPTPENRRSYTGCGPSSSRNCGETDYTPRGASTPCIWRRRSCLPAFSAFS